MSNSSQAISETRLDSLERIGAGKVRDIYAVDASHLLIVASDRMSAFDVVLPDPIPGKGIVLNAVSNFWFEKLAHIVPNHLTGIEPADVVSTDRDREVVAHRSVVVRRMRPLPVEAVVRGYLIGSGWKDYCANGHISGVELPTGLELAEKLREPIFTPSTKAAPGAHDENISAEQVCELIGTQLTKEVEAVSIRLYLEALETAREAGIIIADTKFEFGLDEAGTLTLIDEVLTPDSSRFWSADTYAPGSSPHSFDKQYVRDYLETLDWDKRPPAPSLPSVVIERTRQKYAEVLMRLTTSR